MLQAAEALAGAIYDLTSDASLLDAARKEFAERRRDKQYRPIEDLLKAAETAE